jgi:putative ABC transport system permease protein
MSRTMPAIFLLVAAFLFNQWLNRMVTLEREQIGLLKALGYRNSTIAAHYFKFVVVLVAVGTIIGGVAGTWLGAFLTRMYGSLLSFPFLVFIKETDVYVLGAALSLLAGAAGAVRALQAVVTLPPAVAMQPARSSALPTCPAGKVCNRQVRSEADHHDATQPVASSAAGCLHNVGHGAGDRDHHRLAVLAGHHRGFDQHHIFHIGPTTCAGELHREAAAERRQPDRASARCSGGRALPGGSGSHQKGKHRAPHPDQRQAAGRRPAPDHRCHLRAVALPESGLAISTWLAQILDVQIGDIVEVDLLEGQRRTVSLVVAVLVEDFFGIQG